MGRSSGAAGSRGSGPGTRSRPSPGLLSSAFLLCCIPTGLQAPRSVTAGETPPPASHSHPGEYSDWPAGPHAHREDWCTPWLCLPPGRWDEGKTPQRTGKRRQCRGFSGSPVAGDLPVTAGQTGFIPTGHEATGPPEPQLLKPRACAPQPEKPPQ